MCWRSVKKLSSLIDVARCFKFVEENEKFKSGIYNLIKKILQLRKWLKFVKINPKMEIITDDEVPNKGYTLSNEKLYLVLNLLII